MNITFKENKIKDFLEEKGVNLQKVFIRENFFGTGKADLVDFIAHDGFHFVLYFNIISKSINVQMIDDDKKISDETTYALFVVQRFAKDILKMIEQN